jgi:hypothetical protein
VRFGADSTERPISTFHINRHKFPLAYSSRGTEQSLKTRVKSCFERFKTQLLIIDDAP